MLKIKFYNFGYDWNIEQYSEELRLKVMKIFNFQSLFGSAIDFKFGTMKIMKNETKVSICETLRNCPS
jgi:hypothetical protein